MRNFLKAGLISITLIFVFGAIAVTETNGQINQILKRMDVHYKALKSLQTGVILDKYNSALDELDTIEGKAIFVPSKARNISFRLDWEKPSESLVIANKQYVVFRPALKQALVGSTEEQLKKMSAAKSPLALLNMSLKELKANYTLKYLGQERIYIRQKTWHLELTPKVAQGYTKIEFWVDGDGMPLQMKVVEKNNDWTTISLIAPEKNIPIDGTAFKITLPKDTKIIKN
jgi:outer membrane lipoprotein-sorting protein